MKSEMYDDSRVAALSAEREATIQQAMKDLCGTPQGRELIWWLLEISTLHMETFFGNSRDAYFAGRRFIGRQIEHRLAAVSPETYVSMIKQGEAQGEKR